MKKEIKSIFGENCIIDGSTVEENGRVFSVKKRRGDNVVVIKVDGCLVSSSRSKKCDGLVFAWNNKSKVFCVVMVELKGSDVRRAVSQIRSTAEYLRSITKCRSSQHKMEISSLCGKELGRDHNGKVYGAIVSDRKIPQLQAEKVRMKKDFGVVLKLVHQSKGLTVNKLLKGSFQ